MNRKRKDIFRLLLSDIAIFIFFVFVVSDLINMHLRLIYHIDLFASQNIIQGVVKKVKDNKAKIKVAVFHVFGKENNLSNFKYKSNFSQYIYFSEYNFCISIEYLRNIKNRAPPTLS